LYGETLDGPFEIVADGDSPVWLDDGAIGYHRAGDYLNGPDAELVVTSISGESETLLTQADLEAVLPPIEGDASYYFYLRRADSDWFLISVIEFHPVLTGSSPPQQKYYLALSNRRSGEIAIVAEGENLYGEFGGDGRSLILIDYNDASGIWSLDRYDIVQNQAETLIQYQADVLSALPVSLSRGSVLDWSEDGQWLLVLRDGFLILLAPSYDYKRVIMPDAPGCFDAAWITP
jgi:hypothetical protein